MEIGRVQCVRGASSELGKGSMRQPDRVVVAGDSREVGDAVLVGGRVRRGVEDEDIIACATAEHVVTKSSLQRVVTCAAVERIVKIVAGDDVCQLVAEAVYVACAGQRQSLDITKHTRSIGKAEADGR